MDQDKPLKIILLGYMGSGKSTVGKTLSHKLGLPFYDLDDQISLAAGKSIPEIFEQDGEIFFRKLERDTLSKFVRSHENFVLATGGGTPCYFDNMKLIRNDSDVISIYLRTPVNELAKRLSTERASRPLIEHLGENALPEFIAKHLFERRRFYEEALLAMDTQEATQEKISSQIIQKLGLPQGD